MVKQYIWEWKFRSWRCRRRTCCIKLYNLKKYFIYLFSERGEGRETERGRNINVKEKHQFAASPTPPTRDLACNPGMCPAWESNQ